MSEMDEILDRLRQIGQAKLSDVLQIAPDGTVRIVDGQLSNVRHVRFDKDGRLASLDLYDTAGALEKLAKLLPPEPSAQGETLEQTLRKLAGEEF